MPRFMLVVEIIHDGSDKPRLHKATQIIHPTPRSSRFADEPIKELFHP